MSSIFGDKVPAIINAVASFSGVKQSSASSLLGLAADWFLVCWAKRSSKMASTSLVFHSFYRQKQLDAVVARRNWFCSRNSGISNTGFGSQGTVKEAADHQTIGGCLFCCCWEFGAGIVYFMKNCGSSKAVETSVAVKKDTIAAAPVVAPEVYTNKLSTGFEIKGNIKGIESQLIALLLKMPPNQWIKPAGSISTNSISKPAVRNWIWIIPSNNCSYSV